MDIEKLIEDLHGILKQYGEKIPYGELVGAPWPYSRAGDLVWPDPEPYFIEQAATALSTLQAENEEMQKKLNEFSEFLCHMTGGMLSKTNYTAQAMISAAEDYQQRVCDNYCDLRADLARVTAERDAAIEDLEEIMFKGGHNIDTCHFCTNGQCYGRGGTQVCNPVWRGTGAVIEKNWVDHKGVEGPEGKED